MSKSLLSDGKAVLLAVSQGFYRMTYNTLICLFHLNLVLNCIQSLVILKNNIAIMKFLSTLLALLSLAGLSFQAAIEILTPQAKANQQLEARASGWCSSTKVINGYPGDDGRATKIKYPALNGRVQGCIMGRGAQSSAVKEVQRAVNICGAIPKQIQEDGEYGPKTQAAVRYVQKGLKVSVDGVWGPKTGAAMSWAAYQVDSNGREYAYYCKRANF